MPTPRPLSVPLGASVALHVIVVAVISVVAGQRPPREMPQTYRVNLVAAPAGPRAIGAVQPPRTTPAPAEPRPARTPPPRPAAKAASKAPAQKTVQATPTEATKTPPPKTQAVAGGGPIGGRGTDVATVKIEDGISFPYQYYIDNIVRQIAKNFGDDIWPETFRAEFSFVIKRDGSIIGLHMIEASRGTTLAFRVKAEGAIESAGNGKLFGPLPDGFSDDVLPVVFSFTPSIIR